MNIGETTRAIKVERVGGPKAPVHTTPTPAPAAMPVSAEKRVLIVSA